jgi:pimeloyl-ACP methyl ester carboxylesterase
MSVDSATLAVPPKAGSALGLSSWTREVRALAACMASPPCFPEGDVPRGQGEIVLVMPGFLTGDWTTGRLRSFLARQGYRAEASEVFFNSGPTRGLVEHLERKLITLSDEGSAPIALIGLSLGGVFARGFAHRHPTRVRRVITLCSPIRFPVTTTLEPFVRALAFLHDAEWVGDRERIAARPPVPVTAIYSQLDGIVDWRQCLQDEAPGYENIDVPGTHTTMGSHPEAQRIIAHRLASATTAS